ncbi:uroporphyrinogen-III synthase [Acetobacter orleanensis]|uniref:Uroporphyrinogen-III synthase n=1 Tax=Acetobacter orleanensis TaxID=104099 RepID=A0A4Y3TJS9_9PROT|nr:uroporphyrinogen-III synthase [Acetobacter orleanensis]KXV62826.1 uroporphyrinogen-III synthase [Acetobacter orleanensis]PCD80602.1 uroporphyrinogen-III synthase [Acetobacter orleanensis]GAN68074.1 uroporphyrinogen III synthase [Acetobacter orleanensis JCM 7639]GBR27127.1 uroporphyrinogen-III synthase [Acetobacter orleanensis NRIC 0473]GEB82003.1 uroporphyrinogen III methyltransferase [Acetobacter orleanensis]
MPATGIPPGVLVTRPEPGLSETLAAVSAAGWRAYASPALCITPTNLRALPPRFAACVLTSGQGVQAAQAALPLTCPVYAVGDRTADRARAAGFGRVQSAQGDAEALAALLVRTCTPADGPLLLLSGARQGLELAAHLRKAGFKVMRRVAYTARPVRQVTQEVLSALQAGRITHCLFFSSESAAGWLSALPEAVRQKASRTTAIVISRKTADVLSGAGWTHIVVARHPNAQAMMDALGHPLLR